MNYIKQNHINNIKLVKHEFNKGKGAAIRTGLNYVTGDMVLIQDADLEYDPNDYPSLIKAMQSNNSPVVYGSRLLHKNYSYSYLRFYLGGLFLTKATNFLYNTRITDESTCYKLFKTDLLKNLDLKCNGFEFCPEVTAKVAKKGIRIREIPISYNPRSIKEGKKIRWKDGLIAIWTLLKYKFKN